MLEQNELQTRIADLVKEHLSLNMHSYEDGKKILEEGKGGATAFLILSGNVDIRSKGRHLVTRKKGEVIGEQSLFQPDQKRTADAIALGNVVVLEFQPSDICKLDATDQALFWRWYAKAISQKLAQATEGRVEIDCLRARNEKLLNKFVPKSGVDAAKTALLYGKTSPPPRPSKAIIWFSDLSGFSSATENKTPDQIAEIILTLVGGQITQIEKAGGEIDKLMGDGLMAFWLLPPDSDYTPTAEKAVEVALESHKIVTQLVKENNWPIGIRIGLHIGEVNVGSFGTEDRFAYTIIGEAVNTASRYEQVKGLGDIRLSPEIFEKLPEQSEVRNRFSQNPHPFKIKGDEFKTHVLKETSHDME